MRNELLAALGHIRPVFWCCSDIEKDTRAPFETLEPDLEKTKIGRWGVFFNVNALGEKKNERGNLRHRENVICPLACFADFDKGTFEEQTAKLALSPVPPSAFVKSGRGYHAYWFLTGTEKKDLPLWTETQKAIAGFFGSDEAVNDPARLMRVPGSWHTKSDPVEVKLERCNSDLRYTLNELRNAFPFIAITQTKVSDILSGITGEGARNTNLTKVIGTLLAHFNPTEWESKAWPMALSLNKTNASPPDDERKIRSTFESIKRAESQKREKEQNGIVLFKPTDLSPETQDDSGAISITIPTEDGTARFRFSCIEQSSVKEVDALLSVDFLTPGSSPKPFTARINIVSLTTRATFARELSALGKKIEWRLLLNTACEALLKHLSEKDASIDLAEVIASEAPTLYHPFLAKNTANLLFGDGGTGKTFLGLRLAISLVTGGEFLEYKPTEKVNTLFVDYEDTEQTASYRLSKLCADPKLCIDEREIKRCVRYFNPGGSPLYTIVPALKKIITEHHIGLILVDSVASACGNEPEKAESASRYYNALRTLGITSLSIAHVSKSTTDSNDQNYAFGSIFWHNLARNTWNIRGEEESPMSELAAIAGEPAKQLGLFHRKCNNGPKSIPIALRMIFGSENVRYEKGNLGFWEQNLKAPERIMRLLGSRDLTRKEIDHELQDEKKDTVKSALDRLKAQGIIWLDGGQGGMWKRR